MARESGFRLTKWYLDCVSDAGDAAIFYAAHVSWRALRLRYSSLLSRINGKIACKASMRAAFPHGSEHDALTVDAPWFDMQGTWHPLEPAIEQTLFTNDEGSVDWRCAQPRAAANLRVANHSFAGFGYAECLTLTIPPWRLPLQHLQWGRWLSPAGSLVWIDWRGTFQRRWTWLNGTLSAATSIGPDAVRLHNHAVLRLDRGVTLRDGRLGRTVLPRAPFLARAFPAAMFGIHEVKWLSEAQFLHAGSNNEGWAIHESVAWNS